MPSSVSTKGHGIEHTPETKSVQDSDLCRQVIEIDPTIRAAAIVEGTSISGYAMSPQAIHILDGNSDFREKLGFWTRIVTEMGRQSEPLLGDLESIGFVFSKLKLVTFPISESRSIGFSISRSADTNFLITKIKSKLGIEAANR